jgi:hypothetical protein
MAYRKQWFSQVLANIKKTHTKELGIYEKGNIRGRQNILDIFHSLTQRNKTN